MADPVRVGITLPTFVDDPEVLVRAARAAEEAGLDGVFVFDHLFRIGSGGEGPALALEPVLGLLASVTRRLSVGSLVARASLRAPAVLRSVLDTVTRIAPGRLIAGVGAGDATSDPEQVMFGLPVPDPPGRQDQLERTLVALRAGAYPVWVGGRSSAAIRAAARLADGWNSWNPTPEVFAREVGRLHREVEAAGRDPGEVVATWGGLVELRPDRWEQAVSHPEPVLGGGWDRMAAALRSYVDAGARWLVLAPLAPAEPDHPAVVAAELLPRLR